MAMEHANSFVQKFFEDENFLKLVLEKKGFSRSESRSEEENKRIVKVANDMGFKFDEEEYKKANMEYMNKIGGWNSALKMFRVMKVVARVVKDSGK